MIAIQRPPWCFSTRAGYDSAPGFTFSLPIIIIPHNTITPHKQLHGGLVAQAVRRSPPTAGIPSSRLGPSMWVSWWTKRGLDRILSGVSPVFPYHKFHSTISPRSSHPFHFISPCDGASGVVRRHPCSSLTYNIGASSHLIP